MSAKLVIGVDGSGSGGRALDYAKRLSKMIGACELIIVHVIEWSPFSFQTPEENAERHKRREEEIHLANERILTPALEQLKKDGFNARAIVKHGNVADLLDQIAVDEKAEQIIVARTSDSRLSQRVFGSSTSSLVMQARVPVTVIG